MTRQQVVFDTNVFIRRGWDRPAAEGLLSAVVLQELVAGALDDAELRRLQAMRARYEREERLVVPNGEDWYEAGRILSLLRRGRRSHRTGRVPAIAREEQQRLLRDVLIARSARRIGALVVTEDLDDFRKIRRYCDVRAVHPRRYFS
ncbi:MAG TPA: type II toxin-antitoxin system VapC family toxin [Longimicrobiaceae bacterium]|nr:type II toxin-antitoxin system VapC family toxin [Longimicrobiaceae bacterium]